jgi:hypothetical protein
MDLMDMRFDEVELPQDSIPETSDVEYPCEVCGREAGPYGGRGRKPKRCSEHKKNAASGQNRKVTGATASMAAQATAVLEQINGIITIGLMAVGYTDTARAIAGENEAFAAKAHAALLTDPELCKLILKGGVKSGKISLGIAYASLGVGVIPVAANEFKEKKAAREAAREEAENV